MQAEFLKLANNSFKLNLFLLNKLPAAYFSGVRLVSINEETAVVKVPYKWFSTNPFKSTYFACLAMAAEMSTGLLSMGSIYKRNPAISMLVVGLTGEFYKKATGLTYFTCNQGALIETAIQKSIASGEAVSCQCEALGKNDAGEQIALFKITWSFKVKSGLNK